MENRAHALAAGFFVLALGIAVAVAFWWLNDRRDETREIVIVTQRTLSGLNPQAQVRYRGIRAGKVEAITLDAADPRNLLIRISLNADFPVTRSTTARLNHQGVTGLAYVLLEDDGSDPTPLDGQPPKLTLKPSTFDSIADTVARLGSLLDEKTVGNVKKTLENVATASEGLKELPRVMASVRDVLSPENLRHVQGLLTQMERTLGETAPMTREMRGLVVSLQSLSQRFDRLAADTGGEMTAVTLPRLNALLQDLQLNARQLNRVLDGLEESPQSVLFGRTPPLPGPGESGFPAPPAR